MEEEILENAIRLVAERKCADSDSAIGYNLFSILGMERKEVSAHSSFLFSLLNVDGEHNKNDFFLRKFVENVLGIKTENKNLYSEREVVYSNESDGNAGRIDLVIYINNNRYAIEIKIDAGEQTMQLERYYIYTNNDVYFLTLDGRAATSCEKETLKHIKSISFKKEIVKWLDDCIINLGESNLDRTLKIIITQYINLIKKITDDFKGDMNLMKLIKGKESFVAINELVDAQTEYKKMFMQKFFDRLSNDLDFSVYCEEPIREDEQIDAYYETSTLPQLFYRLKLDKNKLDLLDEHFIYFFIEITHRLYIAISICDKNGDTLEEMPKQYKKIQRLFSGFPNYYKMKDDFRNSVFWSDILCDNKLIDFKKQNDGYFMLMAKDNDKGDMFDETKLKQIINNIKEEFNRVINRLKENKILD